MVGMTQLQPAFALEFRVLRLRIEQHARDFALKRGRRIYDIGEDLIQVRGRENLLVVVGAQNRPIAFGIDDEVLAPVGQRHIRKHTRQKRRRRIADPVVYFSRRRMQPAPMLAVVLEDELLVQPMQRVAIQDVDKPRLFSQAIRLSKAPPLASKLNSSLASSWYSYSNS